MLKNHIKIAFRNLWNSRLFTALNIIGLTGGMVAAVFILLWVQNELSYDSYHKKSDRIYKALTHYQISKEQTWHWPTTPMMLANESSSIPEIETFARRSFIRNLPVKIGDKKVLVKNAAYVDSSWFDVFDYEFKYGSAKALTSGLRNVAVTEERALELFGKTDVVGKLVKVDTLDYSIAAVIKNNPSNSSFKSDFILSLAAYWANPTIYESEKSWSQFNYETYLVLSPDASRDNVAKKLTAVMSQFRKDDKGNPSSDIQMEIEPITDMHFNNEVAAMGQETGDKRTVYIFLGLAIVILIVACINYVNLTTARASVRSKEIGVKKLLGANAFSLFGQFMTESVITCVAALGFSVILIILLLPSFNTLTGKAFEVIFTNASLWYVLLGTTLIAIVLTGVYPSLLLSSFRPFEILRGRNVLGSSAGGFRKGLVVLQFTVTVIFLVSALSVYKQMKFIREKELGYKRDNVLHFKAPMAMREKFDKVAFKSRLTSESSIADVTIASQSIVDIGSSTSGSYDWNGRPKDFLPIVSQISVENNFQNMFGIRMKEGRWFAANREADKGNVVLNETAVKKLNLPKPVIGQRFKFHDNEGMVIGIVKDFHFKSLKEKIEPLVMFQDPEWSMGVYVKIQPNQEAKAIQAVQKIWDEQFYNYPLDYTFLDETYNQLYKTEQRTATLFNTFTLIATLISCMGLFGLATFSAERRLKEIGIRKVLGASVGAILALLSSEFVLLIIIAIVIASPIGYYAMREWLNGFEFRIELNWTVFAIAGIGVMMVTLITVSFQSIKAALMNPVKSLRSE